MSCVVIIPVYRPSMIDFEKASLLRLRQLMPDEAFLVAPVGLCLDEYLRLWPGLRCEYFDPGYFVSVNSYNKLMLSTSLYLRFASKYEWMLVHQLDAFLFHADLQKFINSPFDYFGAPWVPAQLVHPKFSNAYLLKIFGTKITVGNGGLSLRRISATLNLLMSKQEVVDCWMHNEDGFYAYWGITSMAFRSCSLELAVHFAFEREPELLFQMNGQVLPLGCHGLPRYSQPFYLSNINPLISNFKGIELGMIWDSTAEKSKDGLNK